MIIKINVDYEENVTVIEEEKTTDFFMIKNVFSQRKMLMRETHVDILNSTRVIIVII